MRKKPDRWGLVPGQHDLWRYRPIVIPYWEGGGDPRSVDYRRLTGVRDGDVPWIVGSPGRGTSHDGSTTKFLDFGNVVDMQFTDSTSFSILSVFSTPNDGSFRDILAKDVNFGSPRTLLQWRVTNGEKVHLLFGTTGGTLGSLETNTSVTADKVHAICAVRDVAGDQLRLFMDGRLDNEAADGSTGTWTNSTGVVRTGQGGAPTATQSFDGQKFLDIVFPFNALTNNEARQLTLDPYVMLRQAPLNVGRVPDVGVAFIGHGMLLSNTRNRLVI